MNRVRWGFLWSLNVGFHAHFDLPRLSDFTAFRAQLCVHISPVVYGITTEVRVKDSKEMRPGGIKFRSLCYVSATRKSQWGCICGSAFRFTSFN
jgi:hypothetical protein